jgi:dihydrofolate reductase
MPAPLVYFSTVSLDNYREDGDGRFDWSTPDEEVHGFINELFRPMQLHLYGRRNYETMMFWDEDHPELSGASRGWAERWNRTGNVIYSTTLAETRMRRSILRSRFDADEVARWKAGADAPIAIGGGQLASEAARAGLLDEIHLIVTPTLLGAGTPYLAHGIRRQLELLDERRFAGGSVYLRYAMR